MEEMMKIELPNNALMRTSFWLEAVKHMTDTDDVKAMPSAKFAEYIKITLDEAGVTSISAEEITETSMIFAIIASNMFGGPVEVIRSLWLDGVLHGIALSAGLERDTPPQREEPLMI